MYRNVLKKIKNTQIELLDELDRICNENDIKYQLFAGTLLGAVRHGGFIPWDDDIDVCMLRNDYEKFVKVANKQLGNDFILQLPSDENSPFAYGKLRKKESKMVEKLISGKDTEHGIYIDVFQMDDVYPNTFKGEYQRLTLNILHYIKSSRLGIYHKNKFKSALKRFLNIMFFRNYNYYVNKINILSMKYNNSSEHVAHLTCSSIPKKYGGFIYKKTDFINPVMIEFEGKKYPAPRRFHELLTKQYGDYMTPPPIKLQKSHHEIVEVVVDGEKYIIKEKNNKLFAERINNSDEN